MSSFTKFGLLSLVSSAIAAPYNYRPSGYTSGTGAPYGMNTTGPYAPTGSGFPASYPGTSTTTTTIDLTQTVVSTVYMSAVPVTSEAATVGAEAVSSGDVCGPETITVTATNAVTVTVTPGGGYEAASSSVVAAEAVPSSSSQAAYVKHGHHHSHSSRSSVAAVSSAVTSAAYTPPAYTAPAYTPPASSVEEAVSSAVAVPSVYVPVSSAAAVVSSAAAYSSVASAAAYSSAVVSSAATPSATSTPATSGTKRGLAYNDASLTTCFESDSTIGWGYNWAQVSDGLSSKFEYVPMLIDLREMFTSTWETNYKAALKAGTTNFFSFNEPELPAQANLTPKQAADAHIKYMNPVKAAGGRVGAPSVTNGAASDGLGLGYLSNWVTECAGGCDYDFVNIHWYDSATNIQYFKDHVTEAHTQSGKPVWLTEFAATGSDDQIATFLKTVLPWLDEQDFVEKYSYYMVADGVLVSGTTASTIGSVYASA